MDCLATFRYGFFVCVYFFFVFLVVCRSMAEEKYVLALTEEFEERDKLFWEREMMAINEAQRKKAPAKKEGRMVWKKKKAPGNARVMQLEAEAIVTEEELEQLRKKQRKRGGYHTRLPEPLCVLDDISVQDMEAFGKCRNLECYACHGGEQACAGK